MSALTDSDLLRAYEFMAAALGPEAAAAMGIPSGGAVPRSPLHLAASDSDPTAVQTLLDGGADHAATDLMGTQPLQ